MTDATLRITGGVDTHKDAHVAAALDQLGAVLGTQSFPATRAGYRALLEWLAGFGDLVVVGVEGTGAWRPGPLPHRRGCGGRGGSAPEPSAPPPSRQVRPRRCDRRGPRRAVGRSRRRPQDRHRRRRSDPVVAGRSSQRTQGPHPGHQPAPLRARDRPRRAPGQPRRARHPHVVEHAAIAARPHRHPHRRREAHPGHPRPRRCQHLTDEIAELDALATLTARCAPTLVELNGVGTQTAAALLTTAGDNPDRLRSRSLVRGALRQLATRRLIRTTTTSPPQPRR